jgi:putative membrane protein
MSTFKPTHLTMLAIALSLGLPVTALSQNQSSPPPGASDRRPASATEPSNSDTNDATKPSRSDAAFMQEAAMDGMLEVELGRLALQNAASDEVKRFGQQMIDDHSKANDELKSLAQTEGVMLPTHLDSKHAKEVQRMQKLNGAQFDREYMKMMHEDHHHAIKMFTDEGFRGDDPEVKGFALRAVPTLNGHLEMVKQTLSELDPSSGRKAESAARPEPVTRPEKRPQ